MDTLEEFKKIAGVLENEGLKAGKSQGKKIIGTFCSYVPEELISAAGMIPFRMRVASSSGSISGDSWFTSFNCSYVRHLMDLTLEEKFRFLDGVVFVNSCDHLRRLFDNWRLAVDYPQFLHLLAVPRKKEKEAILWYYEELNILKNAIEEHFNVNISDNHLRQAIQISNKIRRRISRLYHKRRSDTPPITGAEMLTVIKAGTAMPREQFLTFLDRLIKEINGRVVYHGNEPRIMLQAGCIEEIKHLEDIEAEGGAVVTDAICLGRRYFDREVDEHADDPLMALAERYMKHLSCPRIADDWQRRLRNLELSIRDYRIDGIICERLKFCDLWGGEAFIYKENAKKNRFPLLYLEREFQGGNEGQLKTRVQAFIEKIKKEKKVVSFKPDNYKKNVLIERESEYGKWEKNFCRDRRRV